MMEGGGEHKLREEVNESVGAKVGGVRKAEGRT